MGNSGKLQVYYWNAAVYVPVVIACTSECKPKRANQLRFVNRSSRWANRASQPNWLTDLKVTSTNTANFYIDVNMFLPKNLFEFCRFTPSRSSGQKIDFLKNQKTIGFYFPRALHFFLGYKPYPHNVFGVFRPSINYIFLLQRLNRP